MKVTTVAVLWTALAFGPAVQAQAVSSLADGRSGEISFTSFGPRGHHELGQGTFDRKPVPITGNLLLPASGDAKLPAVVIGHTVGGVQPFLYTRWAKALNEAGYAVFVVDSFKARGLSDMVGKSAGEFNGAMLVPDAFSALKLLATHPRIDPQRIAYIGFSMGGVTAPYLLQESFRKAVLGDSALRFAASVGHYPGCNYNFHENQPSPTPLYLFLGQKDDWLAAISCQAYADHLAGKGYKVSTKVYEGAGHSYDEDRAAVYVPQAYNTRECRPLVVNLDESTLAPRYLDGALLAPNADTREAARQVYQWMSACTKRGATAGITPGNGDRREDAVRDTLKLLQGVFTASAQ